MEEWSFYQEESKKSVLWQELATGAFVSVRGKSVMQQLHYIYDTFSFPRHIDISGHHQRCFTNFLGNEVYHTFPQISSTGSFETKYNPVDVSFVAFVCTVFPSFKAPFSTTPPPGTGSLARAFAPFRTVKFALQNSQSAQLHISNCAFVWPRC